MGIRRVPGGTLMRDCHRRSWRPLGILVVSAVFASAAASGPPAAIADHDHDRALHSFDRFASDWMAKLQRAAVQSRKKPTVRAQGGVTYRAYGDEYDLELKQTGHPRAPYVGILRYEERLYSCSDASTKRCRVGAVTPVTEIFRLQDGRWVY